MPFWIIKHGPMKIIMFKRKTSRIQHESSLSLSLGNFQGHHLIFPIIRLKKEQQQLSLDAHPIILNQPGLTMKNGPDDQNDDLRNFN
jgi:hypothetical protein